MSLLGVCRLMRVARVLCVVCCVLCVVLCGVRCALRVAGCLLFGCSLCSLLVVCVSLLLAVACYRLLLIVVVCCGSLLMVAIRCCSLLFVVC